MLKILSKLLVVLLPLGILGGGGYYLYTVGQEVGRLKSDLKSLKEQTENLNQNLPEFLYSDHLAYMTAQTIALNLETQLAELEKTATEQPKYTGVYNLYDEFQSKLTRNSGAKLSVTTYQEKLATWGGLLLEKKFDELTTQLTEANQNLDNDYKAYLATLPPPPPAPTEGYSYQTVRTEKGTTHGVYLIKLPLASVKVKTVSAESADCKKDCDTKTLADHIKDAGGFAGMNGSYFCPPDYAECAGKTNYYEYALYSSDHDKWINKHALGWVATGLITFKDHSASFYKKSSDYGGDGVDAAISNYPSLLKDGEVVVKDSSLTAYQKIKGTRGAIGVGGENIYLAIVTSATVEEAAYAMKTLGAKHALNLDGGGSSAMYINDRYVVGPGRSLPNAVVLVK